MKRPSNGFVNTPIYKGSTVIYSGIAEMEDTLNDPLKTRFPAYGRFGSPNVREFEQAMTELEGGFSAVCTNSGLSSITTALLAFVQAGDHILIANSVYQPTRNFCDSLARWGIVTEYYNPTLSAEEFLKKIRTNTRLAYFESPGSNTFEIQDIPALTKICRANGIISFIDNTWATPILLNPLQLGVDVCIHSATKYISGHSDSILGVIVCTEETYAPVRQSAIRLGQCGAAEDAYAAVRGLRTLNLRLRQHEQQALALARWLKDHPSVEEVIHPALPSFPQHHIWQRDFRGSSGLFAVRLKPALGKTEVIRIIESLKHFGLGHSWGGVESLLVPVEFHPTKGALLRIHAGLENLEELISDLKSALSLAPLI
jgi:cystathionine beta-lyase